MIVAATVERVRLPGGDVEAALAALAEHGERMEHRCGATWMLASARGS